MGIVFSKELIQKIREQKSRAVSDQNPNLWRKDESGAWVRREHYGRRDSEFGWEIELYYSGWSPRARQSPRVALRKL